MPKCGFTLIAIRTGIAKTCTPRLSHFGLYNSPAWLMWPGDYATYNVEVFTAIAEWIFSSWIPIVFVPRVVSSPPSLVGSGRHSTVAATSKTCSDWANITVVPSSWAAAFRWGKRCLFFQDPKTGMCNPWPVGQKWPGSWSFVIRGKEQIFKQALWFFKGICMAGLRVL